MGHLQVALVGLVQSASCKLSEKLRLSPSSLPPLFRKDDDDDQDPELKKLRAGLSSALYVYNDIMYPSFDIT